jgi:hypothetical protein
MESARKSAASQPYCDAAHRIGKAKSVLSYRFRSLAVKAAVTAIVIAVVSFGLFYSGMVTNALPRDLLFGS